MVIRTLSRMNLSPRQIAVFLGECSSSLSDATRRRSRLRSTAAALSQWMLALQLFLERSKSTYNLLSLPMTPGRTFSPLACSHPVGRRTQNVHDRRQIKVDVHVLVYTKRTVPSGTARGTRVVRINTRVLEHQRSAPGLAYIMSPSQARRDWTRKAH